MKLPVVNSSVSLFRQDVPYDDDLPSMTRQDMADECDVNQIMARYARTGTVPLPAGQAAPQYLDLTMSPPDLMTAMDLMINAEVAFMSLPALVRKEFDNDPVRFVEFASDEANIGRMREFGLAPPEPEEAPPMRVEVVPGAGSVSPAGEAPGGTAVPPKPAKS